VALIFQSLLTVFTPFAADFSYILLIVFRFLIGITKVSMGVGDYFARLNCSYATNLTLKGLNIVIVKCAFGQLAATA
jgi:hypothetical protein